MVSNFYNNYGRRLLWLVLFSFPILVIQARSLPVNNDIETWLPEHSTVRVAYREFKEEFGAEEVILVAVSSESADDERLLAALCGRLERLPGIRQCYSPASLQTVMQELGVPEQEIHERLSGFLISRETNLVGLVASLSETGLKNRIETVRQVREQVEYCQLRGEEISLAGGPVVVSELDRLGGHGNNSRFFLITLSISVILLYVSLRHWKLSLSIVALTLWAIELTMTIIKLAGGEKNFILGALSVMVMVFTLAVAIHFLHYYRASLAKSNPLGAALLLAWKPCCLATLTTTIGLISLTVSDIAPVRQFGYAASIGSLVALATGLGLTPALLALWPHSVLPKHDRKERFASLPGWMLARSGWVTLGAGALTLIASVGLLSIETKIDPLEFLPKDSKVLTDIRRVEQELTNTSTIEGIVDFGTDEVPFVEKLDRVRELESTIAEHPAVRHTMSVATFFPRELPTSALESARLLKRARARQDRSEFTADGGRLWRITARISSATGQSRQEIFDDLVAVTADSPITFTGIAPLLENAQHAIFDGFWESFAMAFGIITLVMVVSLRSLKLGLVAMIPNLTPICIVFGILGWCRFPIDIGMMMTGSIALGIAVDGTFHFLVRYNEHFARTRDARMAARTALQQTGAPIFSAAAVASIGMLALTLSNFTPTARFGYMMTSLLLAALVGDLVLLPAVLSLRPTNKSGRKKHQTRETLIRPHQSARAVAAGLTK